jgi:hypothetical protein
MLKRTTLQSGTCFPNAAGWSMTRKITKKATADNWQAIAWIFVFVQSSRAKAINSLSYLREF